MIDTKFSEILTHRFLRYVKIHTTSDPRSESFPSTDRQLSFASMLAGELRELGLDDVSIDDFGYVMATLPSNCSGDFPVVGFIAHYDTSPDFSGENVHPQLVLNYAGGPIILKSGLVLDPEQFPELKKCVGLDLITTDGTTLLGADDKAGIAEIVTAMQWLLQAPHIKHGKIRVGFTPDEEIGRGADHFDVEKFGADFAYTLDGSELGELEFENFNAAYAKLSIKGKSVHPGTAKDKMINALMVANRFINALPAGERPEHTEGYEGFFHVVGLTGGIDAAELEMIIRDHDKNKFEDRKAVVQNVCEQLNREYGSDCIALTLKDQYYNMREKIEPVMHVVELARRGMEAAGVDPVVKAIRGGTDGSRLSYMGLPCPNLFAGGINFHGPYEFVPIQFMEKATEVIIHIARLNAERNSV